MRFVHLADLHFDVPFTSLGVDENLIQKRKLEQREAFRNVIEYIKENGIDYLFIAGDLYENEYIKDSTVEYINNLFKEIPDTTIFISPGNHDPYIKNSVYDRYSFSDNVYIFKSSSIEKYEDENIEIYGMAFEDFYMNKNPLENFSLEKSNKPQILLTHCDLNGIIESDGEAYNPISDYQLRALNFDYVAMGHIHKSNYREDSKTIYPGSLISLGFDEPGEHGMVVGEFRGKVVKTRFERVDNREFIEQIVNIESMSSQNDLIEYLSTLYFEKDVLVKIVLKGNRRFLVNTKELMNLVDNVNIKKIKDQTRVGFDLDSISNEKSLKGIFVKKLLEKKGQGFYSDEEIDKAIEIGLEAME